MISNRVQITIDPRASNHYIELDAIKVTGHVLQEEIECKNMQDANCSLVNFIFIIGKAESVSTSFTNLVNCSEYSDVVFIVHGDKQAYAHKAILLSRTVLFEKVLADLKDSHVVSVLTIIILKNIGLDNLPYD